MDNRAKAKAAALWLYLVAAATLLNSLLLQLFSRFIDLLAGLSVTQVIDAYFLGMRFIEPPGAPPVFEIGIALIADVLIVLFVIILAVRISHRSRRAAAIAFFLYTLDTVAFAFSLGVSILSRDFRWWTLSWQALTVLVHVAGAVIIFRAWRALRDKLPPQVEPAI